MEPDELAASVNYLAKNASGAFVEFLNSWVPEKLTNSATMDDYGEVEYYSIVRELPADLETTAAPPLYLYKFYKVELFQNPPDVVDDEGDDMVDTQYFCKLDQNHDDIYSTDLPPFSYKKSSKKRPMEKAKTMELRIDNLNIGGNTGLDPQRGLMDRTDARAIVEQFRAEWFNIKKKKYTLAQKQATLINAMEPPRLNTGLTLESFYKKEAPEKLKDKKFIPMISARYESNESKLFDSLAQRYGRRPTPLMTKQSAEDLSAAAAFGNLLRERLRQARAHDGEDKPLLVQIDQGADTGIATAAATTVLEVAKSEGFQINTPGTVYDMESGPSSGRRVAVMKSFDNIGFMITYNYKGIKMAIYVQGKERNVLCPYSLGFDLDGDDFKKFIILDDEFDKYFNSRKNTARDWLGYWKMNSRKGRPPPPSELPVIINTTELSLKPQSSRMEYRRACLNFYALFKHLGDSGQALTAIASLILGQPIWSFTHDRWLMYFLTHAYIVDPRNQGDVNYVVSTTPIPLRVIYLKATGRHIKSGAMVLVPPPPLPEEDAPFFSSLSDIGSESSIPSSMQSTMQSPMQSSMPPPMRPPMQSSMPPPMVSPVPRAPLVPLPMQSSVPSPKQSIVSPSEPPQKKVRRQRGGNQRKRKRTRKRTRTRPRTRPRTRTRTRNTNKKSKRQRK